MDPYPSASGDGRRAVSWQATWSPAEGRRSAVATVDPPACELRIDSKVRRLRVRLEASAPLVLLVKMEGVWSCLVLAVGVLHGKRLLSQGAHLVVGNALQKLIPALGLDAQDYVEAVELLGLGGVGELRHDEGDSGSRRADDSTATQCGGDRQLQSAGRADGSAATYGGGRQLQRAGRAHDECEKLHPHPHEREGTRARGGNCVLVLRGKRYLILSLSKRKENILYLNISKAGLRALHSFSWHATSPPRATEPRHSRLQPRARKIPRKGAPATREGGVEHDGSARAARQRRAVEEQRAQPAEVGHAARVGRERAERLTQQRRAARVGQQPAQCKRVDHLEHVEARVGGERHALERGDGARVVQEVGRQLEAKVGREAHLVRVREGALTMGIPASAQPLATLTLGILTTGVPARPAARRSAASAALRSSCDLPRSSCDLP